MHKPWVGEERRDASYSLYWSQSVHFTDINITSDHCTLHHCLARPSRPTSSELIKLHLQLLSVLVIKRWDESVNRLWWWSGARCDWMSLSISECQVSQTEKIISELQPGAAVVMGWFEFPHLILRDRLHINYSIIELNYYLTAQLEGREPHSFLLTRARNKLHFLSLRAG